MTEAANEVTEENLPDTGTVNNIEGASEAASFDELYERAMNTFDEEAAADAAASDEADDAERSYASAVTEQPDAYATVSPPPDSPAHIQQSHQRQYSYEEDKKSPIVYVIAGIIAVLLVGGGILGGMLLMKNKDNKDSDNSSNNAVIASTPDAETTAEISSEPQSSSSEAATTVSETTTEAATTTSSETTTAETTTEVPTETASPENGLKAFPSSDINNYPQYIQVIKNGMNSGYYTESSASYGLYDLNADGIPELIINTAPYGIYAMDGNNCVELQSSFTATRSPSLSLRIRDLSRRLL